MANKPDIRSWCNPLPPNYGERGQSEQLTGEIYKPNKGQDGRAELIKSVRKGSIVEVVELFLLAKVAGRADVRRRDLLKVMDEIEDKGGTIRELSTGDEAPRRQRRMLLRAYEMIANSGRGRRSAENGKLSKGRPERKFTKEQWDAAERIWFSRRYKTRQEATLAIQALGIPMGRTLLYSHFGVPETTPTDPREVGKIDLQKPRRKRRTFVYFLKDGDKVKIGFSTKPTARMNSIKTHSKLEFLAIISGGRQRETALHRKFNRFKVEGTREWFHIVPAITKYVSGLKSRLKP